MRAFPKGCPATSRNAPKTAAHPAQKIYPLLASKPENSAALVLVQPPAPQFSQLLEALRFFARSLEYSRLQPLLPALPTVLLPTPTPAAAPPPPRQVSGKGISLQNVSDRNASVGTSASPPRSNCRATSKCHCLRSNFAGPRTPPAARARTTNESPGGRVLNSEKPLQPCRSEISPWLWRRPCRKAIKIYRFSP